MEATRKSPLTLPSSRKCYWRVPLQQRKWLGRDELHSGTLPPLPLARTGGAANNKGQRNTTVKSLIVHGFLLGVPARFPPGNSTALAGSAQASGREPSPASRVQPRAVQGAANQGSLRPSMNRLDSRSVHSLRCFRAAHLYLPMNFLTWLVTD